MAYNRKKLFGLKIFGIILGIFFLGFSSVFAALPSGFEMQTIASGLNLPTTIAFAPDGRVFIAEKGGTVRVVKNDILLTEPVITLSDVNAYGDRGLIGMAIDPNFSQNGYLYLSYTYENSPGLNFSGIKTGRIVRVTVVGDKASESSKVVLLGSVGGNAATPSCDNFAVTADCIPSDSQSHSVGGLRFGPDGKLYASTGDGASFDYADSRSLRAQNLDSLAGKLLRINTDGTAPADNPFYNGNPNDNRSKVYAYGIRNMFRFNFHPVNGILLGGDVGWNSWEELDKIVPGGNYGWPCREGNGATVGHSCTALGYIDPVYTYPHNVSGAGSVTSGSFPTGAAYPVEFANTFFFGDYAQNWIKTATVSATGTITAVNDFAAASDGTNGPVEFLTSPSGNVYFLAIYTGELKRITHTLGNRQPIAQISANNTSGLSPLSVIFSSTGSSDPDGNPITFLWNFGDNTTSTLANPTHVYNVNGKYTATLTVFDNQGGQQTKSIEINVGNRAPTATITSPSVGTLYIPGDVLQLSGNGTDPEDGALANSSLAWRVILHHNTHTHVLETHVGNNIAFTAPDHADPDVYTEIELTVTDSAGLTGKTSLNIHLNNAGNQIGNLIANPSLETPSLANPQVPENWFADWWGNLIPVFTYPVAGQDGAKAAKLEVTQYTSGDAKWNFAPVSVVASTTYTFSDYYLSTAQSTLVVEYGMPNGTHVYQNLGTLPAATTWTKVTKTFTSISGANTFSVFHLLERAGSLTVDNYSLIKGTSTPVDTIPPSVLITSPAASSTVSGSVTITATSSDNVGVSQVQFYVDALPLGSPVTTSPYSMAWNTASSTNGNHILSAVSKDIAGNTATSSNITVNVSNSVGTTSPNLITNGTFETVNGTLPLGWKKGGWGTNTRVLTYPVAGSSSAKAARVEITAYPANGTGDAKWVHDKIPVTPGTQYSYTDRYRSNIISDVIGEYTLSNGTLSYFGLAKEIQPSATWQTVTGTFSPPVNATHVTFYHLISSVGFVEIDDVDVHALGNGTPGEIIPPVVEFTNPLNGQTVSGTINLTASSSDNVAVTYIFYAVDGTPITGQLTQSPYTFSWNTNTVTNGSHLLKATTHDPSGNNSTATITVNVNNSSTTPPVTNNLILNPSLETPKATNPALPDKWQNGKFGTNTTVFTYPVAGSSGARGASITMSAYSSGDAKWFFDDVAVTAGQQYVFSEYYKSSVPTTVTIRYRKTAGGYIYQTLGSANVPAAANWTRRENTLTVPAGVNAMTVFHTLKAVGNLSIDNYSLSTPDTQSPTISLISPTASSTLSGTTTIQANATDNVAIASVQFYLDGNPFGSEDTTSPYSIPLDTTSLSNGPHTVFARATDTSQNKATSTSVGFNVSNTLADVTPPTLTITTPSNGATISNAQVIRVDANDDVGVSIVHILINGVNAGSYTTLPYETTVDTTTYQNGVYEITAYAEDAAGNIGNASPVSITVNNIPVITPAENIISNPSLETPDPINANLPQNWFTGNWGTNNTTFTYPVAGTAGAKAARVEMTSYTDGDAKWYFADVPIASSTEYAFKEKYRSSIPTVITARFKYADNSVQYRDIITTPASANWTTAEANIVIPPNATQMTLFHILAGVGWLETDDYYLSGTSTVATNPNEFSQGLVSLTFDDGWVSQYENALPILNNANLKACFYIISQESIQSVPDNRVANPGLDIADVNNPNLPERWYSANVGTNSPVFTYPVTGPNGSAATRVEMTSYTDGDAKWYFDDATVIGNQWYTYKHNYRSTAQETLTARFTFNDNSVTYQTIGTLPASANWTQNSQSILMPSNLKSVTIFHTISGLGFLEIDDADLNRVPVFMNPTQITTVKNAGHEIGSHTQTHPFLTTLPAIDATREIEASKSDLLGIGLPVTTLAYPYGDYNDAIAASVKNAGYAGARSVDRGFNQRNTDKYKLQIQQADRTTTFAQFQSWVDSARNNKTWLILMYHQIDGTDADLGVTPALLQEMVNFLVTEQVNVVTVQQGLQQMLP